MSNEAQIFNPTATTLEATGNGITLCRMTTARRLALVLGATDRGLIVYDDTLAAYYQWSGTGWLEFSSASSVSALYSGIGSPEGVVTAATPSIYFDLTNPAAPIQYIKSSGSGNTGWI